jgi:hypothetical protein
MGKRIRFTGTSKVSPCLKLSHRNIQLEILLVFGFCGIWVLAFWHPAIPP